MEPTVSDLASWSLPDPQAVIDTTKRRLNQQGTAAPSRWVFTSRISPVDLYAYLKWRFGPPNGFAMMLRAQSVDNLIHWHYTLQCPGSILEITGLSTRIEIVAASAIASDDEWGRLEDVLSEDISRHVRDIAELKKGFEHWRLFVNPYQRLARIAQGQEERLREIELPHVETPPVLATEEEMHRFQAAMTSAMKTYEEAAALCVNLQMIAPVMGEAAVNFIIAVLAKPELRADKRLRDNFTRQPIDVRIKTLHLNCEGFKQQVSGGEDEVKDFLRLMNRRNDALHGNLSLDNLKGEELLFDFRTIPLPSQHHSLAEAAIASAFAELSPDAALEDIRVARRFVDLMVSCLEERCCGVVRQLMSTLQLGYRSVTGTIGAILPQASVELFLGAEPETEA